MNPRTPLATLLLALALTACATPPPPAPPAPDLIRPDGTLVVTNPRSTSGVDPCTLIPPEELRDIFGSDGISGAPNDTWCYFTGGGVIYLYLDENSLGEPPPPDQVGRAGVVQSARPTAVIAGNAATIGGDQFGCGMTIALDPRPATSSITLSSSSFLTCDQLRGIAERIINRLPLAA